MRKLILISLLNLFLSAVQAQKDTLFWFVAPEATSNHGDSPVLVRMSAGTGTANVIIDQPANAGFTPIPVSIPAGTGQSVDLTAFLSSLENIPANTVLDKGLRIRSDAFISAYYEVNTSCNCNPEIYALKGKNALGTSFIIPFQTAWNNGASHTPPAHSAIDIVATENNTQVTITPSNAVLGHAAGVAYTITLNKGQTYSIRQASQTASGNLSGTLVTSDKKIAVTIKDDSLNFGACEDLAGDQIVPVEVTGDEYIVVKGSLNVTDKVFIVPTQNNTTIRINGTAQPGSYNRGQSFMYDLTAGSIYIESSAPVYVLHYTGFGCEIGSALVPPLKCTGSRDVYVVRSTDEYFGILLFTRTANVGNFQVNGGAGLITAGNFTPVPGTGGLYSSALVSFTTGQIPAGNSVTVTNSSGVFHMGILNGGATSGCRYGFFSDFSGQIFSAQVTQPISCYGGSDGELDLEVIGGLAPYSYQWSNGDTTQDLTGLGEGRYTVHVTDVSGCSDSSTFEVTQPDALELDWNLVTNVTCFNGNNGALGVTPGGGTPPYTVWWSTGAGSNPLTGLTAGAYSAFFTDDHRCDTLRLDTVITQPVKMPLDVAIDDSVLCVGQSTDISASGATFYDWSPFYGLSSATGSDISAVFNRDTTVTYKLIGTNAAGCSDSLLFVLKINKYLGPKGPFTVEVACFGEATFSLSAAQSDSLYWEFGDGGKGTGSPLNHVYEQAGLYQGSVHIVDVNGCDTLLVQPVNIDASQTLDQVKIPNIITPNGDGTNDRLILDPAFDECNTYRIKIMNRWGQKIYEGVKGDAAFEGKAPFGGKLTAGVYFYVIEVNGKYKNGTLTINY